MVDAYYSCCYCCLCLCHYTEISGHFCDNLPATISVFSLPPKEFEIELEGSQTLRLLCYEKCYNKTKQNKEDGESTDRIMGKGQIPV